MSFLRMRFLFGTEAMHPSSTEQSLAAAGATEVSFILSHRASVSVSVEDYIM